MGKKSNAQINRMKRRAATRGEDYVEPTEFVERKKNSQRLEAVIKLQKELKKIDANDTLKAKERRSAKRKAEAIASEEAKCTFEELMEWYKSRSDEEQKNKSGVEKQKLEIARQLQSELAGIESDENLKAKDRRSAKRKAEAIAAEKAGCSAEELLEWLAQYKEDTPDRAGKNTSEGDQKPFHNPYIVFVGQLAYTTTREGLFQHFQKELGKEHTVTNETLRIRLLTDSKTRKSRGMAFVETTDPELLYACLKLHHTELDGRRINVERSAGGKRNSDTRKSKITQYRKEQEQHMSETVDKMLQDYKASGDLDQDEFDEGVISLCKRHSASTIEAALGEYVEARGREMDNPSAYLTFIIGRIASEGVTDEKLFDKFDKRRGRDGARSGHEKNRSDEKSKRSGEQSKKRHLPNITHGTMGNRLQKQSEFSKAGIDMSISSATKAESNLSKIFPSISRGRGRGRGYM